MKTLDMTKGNPLSLLLKFAIPLLIGTMFQQVYNLVDTMIVGYGLDENAVAAVGSTSSLYAVIIWFAIGMNNGFGVTISRLFGAGKMGQLRKAVATMIVLDVITALVLTSVTLPLLRPMLSWLQTPQEIFDDAHAYIFVIIAGMIATIAYNMGAGFLRAIGNSRTPLYFLVLSCLLNIGLDSLFIFVMKLGVIGAGIATIIAQAVSAICCVWYVLRNYKEYLPNHDDWHLQKNLTTEMLATGLSMGLMSSVTSMGSIVLQKGVNELGTTIVTAHTVSRRLFELMSMPLSTLSQAAATFVGQNYGAGEYQRIRDGIKTTIYAQYAWTVVTIIVTNLFGANMISWIIDTRDVMIISNALSYLRVCTVFFLALGPLLVLRNAMQSMGDKITPVFSSAIELFVKVAFGFYVIPRMGYWGVIITEPLIWAVCAIYLLIIYRQMMNRMMRAKEKNEAIVG